jgi:hypothetical protein
MNDWTPAAAAELARTSMQVGLSPNEAVLALTVGARMLAHGFDQEELDDMVQHAYAVRAEDERAIEEHRATVTQIRRHWKRRGTTLR